VYGSGPEQESDSFSDTPEAVVIKQASRNTQSLNSGIVRRVISSAADLSSRSDPQASID
jgi:hypothetical protein